MDRRLLDILVCPVCKSKLRYDTEANELICTVDRLAYPIKDDIPLMLESAARELAGTPSENVPATLVSQPRAGVSQ